MLEDQVPPLLLVDGGGVLQHHAQVVGQLGVIEGHAGGEVGLLEPQQGHPAFAGVSVGEVGEEEVAAAPVVEGVDVVGLQLGQRRRLQMSDEVTDRLTGLGRQLIRR